MPDVDFFTVKKSVNSLLSKIDPEDSVNYISIYKEKSDLLENQEFKNHLLILETNTDHPKRIILDDLNEYEKIIVKEFLKNIKADYPIWTFLAQAFFSFLAIIAAAVAVVAEESFLGILLVGSGVTGTNIATIWLKIAELQDNVEKSNKSYEQNFNKIIKDIKYNLRDLETRNAKMEMWLPLIRITARMKDGRFGQGDIETHLAEVNAILDKFEEDLIFVKPTTN
ncbi:MAG: hypothetical protein HeimC3_41430 [Candidatus Heimdallarchaeota archaeon LC_3]|nr:MAG: hypothetical protein HeimC3_41430 [Candidatus Heimdallarchaeota archaeon LC_3]